MTSPTIDLPALRALIAHVFLLPKFPDKWDEKLFAPNLVEMLESVLEHCERVFPQHKRCINACRQTLRNFQIVRGSKQRIDRTALADLLNKNSPGLSTSRYFLACYY